MWLVLEVVRTGEGCSWGLGGCCPRLFPENGRAFLICLSSRNRWYSPLHPDGQMWKQRQNFYMIFMRNSKMETSSPVSSFLASFCVRPPSSCRRGELPGRSSGLAGMLTGCQGFESRRTRGRQGAGTRGEHGPQAGLSAAEVHFLRGDTPSVPAVAAHGE